MSLSCRCDLGWYPEPGDVFVSGQSDFKKMLFISRRKKCCSCKEIIQPNDTVLEFYMSKIPCDDVEIAIYGEEGEINRASLFMCESCSDIFLSLEEIGYCPQVNVNQRRLLQEHLDMRGSI